MGGIHAGVAGMLLDFGVIDGMHKGTIIKPVMIGAKFTGV